MKIPSSTTPRVLVKIECWVEVAAYGDDWLVGDMVKQARQLAEDRMRAVLSRSKVTDIGIAKITSHQVISSDQA